MLSPMRRSPPYLRAHDTARTCKTQSLHTRAPTAQVACGWKSRGNSFEVVQPSHESARPLMAK
jgi:hypothetical protein